MSVNLSLQSNPPPFQSPKPGIPPVKESYQKVIKNIRLPLLYRYYHDHWQAIKSAGLHLKTYPFSSLLTTLAIGITLGLPLILFIIFANAQTLTAKWQEGTQITMFLQQNTTQADIDALVNQLQFDNDIAKVTYISPQQGLADLRDKTDIDDVLTNLPYNPLPPVIEIQPKDRVHQPQQIQALFDRVKQLPHITKAELDEQWVQRLHQVIVFFKRFTYLLQGLFAAGACMVIGVMIRLAVSQHRHDLEVLKLITASSRYMRRPFLYTGIFYGLSGGLLALIIANSGLSMLAKPVRLLAQSYQSSFSLTGFSFEQSALFLLFAFLIGLISARLATSLYIHRIKAQ